MDDIFNNMMDELNAARDNTQQNQVLRAAEMARQKRLQEEERKKKRGRKLLAEERGQTFFDFTPEPPKPEPIPEPEPEVIYEEPVDPRSTVEIMSDWITSLIPTVVTSSVSFTVRTSW